MTGANGRTDSVAFTKHAAMAVIENLPKDASFDEIVDGLWVWSMAIPEGAAACTLLAKRNLAVNPAELVMASRAARDIAVLGQSRQIAVEVVQALPDDATLEDVLFAVTIWHWPDEVEL